MRKLLGVLLAMALLAAPALALGQTRALLVACKEFVSQPNLGSAISGNLHMIGSALLGAGLRRGELSIEDGTIGTVAELERAMADTFADAVEDDLSLLYLCTHGVLSSADDARVYLLLGDGQTENPLSAQTLYALLSAIPGEKLLIVDACYSGALIGHGAPEVGALPGALSATPVGDATPFLADPSIHVLTSASGTEASWYYDSDGLQNGAVSYFASALSTGLGLYGALEADADGDGGVTLEEMRRYLSVAVPSSSAQCLSTDARAVALPVAAGAMLSRPLTGFTYSASLLRAQCPTLEFAYTVTRETAVQYRLVPYRSGLWDWNAAQTFWDADGATLPAGRKTRALSLEGVMPEDSGYLMLQIFSVSGSEVILCSERLLAVQPEDSPATLALGLHDAYPEPGLRELPIAVRLNVPAEITVSIFDDAGALVRRLASSQLTRPAPDDAMVLYWDGRDAQGDPVPTGRYIVAAEARVGRSRQKAMADVTVGVQSAVSADVSFHWVPAS